MITLKNIALCLTALSLIATSLAARAEIRVLVLDYELKDLSGIPQTDEQMALVQTVSQLLREQLAVFEQFHIIPIDADVQAEADKGFGYLYGCLPCTGELGRSLDSDWVVVGRVHKPGNLFSYLMTKVIDSDTNELLAEYKIEVKGQAIAWEKGVTRLSEKLHVLASNRLASVEAAMEQEAVKAKAYDQQR